MEWGSLYVIGKNNEIYKLNEKGLTLFSLYVIGKNNEKGLTLCSLNMLSAKTTRSINSTKKVWYFVIGKKRRSINSTRKVWHFVAFCQSRLLTSLHIAEYKFILKAVLLNFNLLFLLLDISSFENKNYLVKYIKK